MIVVFGYPLMGASGHAGLAAFTSVLPVVIGGGAIVYIQSRYLNPGVQSRFDDPAVNGTFKMPGVQATYKDPAVDSTFDQPGVQG